MEIRPLMDLGGPRDVTRQSPGRRGPAARARAAGPRRARRRYGQFDDCEDAVQEALLAAALQWPEQGVPDNPRGWLITVASRRLTDQLRGDSARRQREARAAALLPPEALVAPAPEDDGGADEDDTLTLLFLCCHPALSPASQVALTLRAVGGLTTAQIARAFLVPEATMAQRISRAKAEHQGRRRQVHDAARRRARRAACGWSSTSST